MQWNYFAHFCTFIVPLNAFDFFIRFFPTNVLMYSARKSGKKRIHNLVQPVSVDYYHFTESASIHSTRYTLNGKLKQKPAENISCNCWNEMKAKRNCRRGLWNAHITNEIGWNKWRWGWKRRKNTGVCMCKILRTRKKPKGVHKKAASRNKAMFSILDLQLSFWFIALHCFCHTEKFSFAFRFCSHYSHSVSVFRTPYFLFACCSFFTWAQQTHFASLPRKVFLFSVICAAYTYFFFWICCPFWIFFLDVFSVRRCSSLFALNKSLSLRVSCWFV